MHFHAYLIIPFDVQDVEQKVSELMAPYDANLESIPYPRECECVYESALKKLETGQYAMNGNVNGPVVEFTKEGFGKNGPEIIQKLELLRLGTPDPTCADCRGSGISATTHNCQTQWDSWEIVSSLTMEGFKECLKSGVNIPSDQQRVPVSTLNLDKVPAPRAVVTPDGVWHTYKKFIWFSNATIMDENWEHTFKNLLAAYPDATLVVADCHI